MSSNTEPTIDVEQVEEKRRRGRGKNKEPLKTADPDYFKNYYLTKSQPKLYSDDRLFRCQFCHKFIYKHNAARHIKTKSCIFTKLQLEKREATQSV